MPFHEETITSAATGLKIFRRHRPVENPRGAVLMLHGLGDHLGCHRDAEALFAEQNFATFGIDWPGNGKSEGIRGDIPSVEAACQLVDEATDWIRETGFHNIGVYAHSTGGFFLLRYIALRQKNPFDWIWLSSPLIEPRFGKSKFLQIVAPFAARLSPKMTVSTGVTRKKCHHIRPDNPNPGEHQIEGRHSRVSLRLGASLLAHGEKIHEAATVLADPVRILYTQGDEDQICPAEFSRPVFDRFDVAEKKQVLLPGFRHELFREPDNSEFIKLANDWLADL